MKFLRTLAVLAVAFVFGFTGAADAGSLTLLGVGKASASAPPSFPGLTHWNTCAKAAVAGTGGCAIVLDVGDSTSAGCCSTSMVYTQTKAYQAYSALLAAGLPVIYNWWCGNGNSVGDGNITDSRVVMGAGWGLDNSLGGGQMCPGAGASAAGTLAFTPTSSIDTCDIYYAKGAATGVATVNFDGGATLATLVTAGTDGFYKATVTTTSGTHTLNIVWVSGDVFFSGMECYVSAGNKIRIINGGYSGTVSGDYAPSTGFVVWSVLAIMQPALIVTNLGINDWENAVGTSTYSSNMSAVITNALATSGAVDVMLEFPHSTGGSANEATQLTYGSVLTTLAAGGKTVFSPRATMGTWATVNTAGKAFDTLHYNASGQATEGPIEAAPLIATGF